MSDPPHVLNSARPPPAKSRPRSTLSSAAETATTSSKDRIRKSRPPPPPPPPPPRREARVPLRLLLQVTIVASGVQFGWALQLSLLTPYVQELGIPHSFASFVWLCGPISGLLVQPLVGHMSDRCANKLGRRRPFILSGAAVIAFSVLLIGYAADIGGILGDPADAVVRPRAIGVFVVGFWLLDVGNNTIQGPCRALLADLTGKDHRRTRVANAYYSLFMALGSILGYGAGSFSGWFKILPFTLTSACNINCANLKSVFLIDVVFLVLTTYVSISSVKEVPLSSTASSHPGEETPAQEAFFWDLLGVFRYVTLPIWIILIVTALNWIGWFPFTLFDTDWMGREIYRGDPNGGQNYHAGVRMGAFGLMLNAIVLGFTSIMLEKLCRNLGSGLVWGISTIVLSFCLGAMLVITAVVKNMEFSSTGQPPTGMVVAALIVFTILGAPLAITYSLPYALISARIEALGLGQGLAMGVLNLAIVIPQIIVSLGSGPWDQLFGGGNSAAFAVGAASAFLAGLGAIVAIPRAHQPGKPKERR